MHGSFDMRVIGLRCHRHFFQIQDFRNPKISLPNELDILHVYNFIISHQNSDILLNDAINNDLPIPLSKTFLPNIIFGQPLQ